MSVFALGSFAQAPTAFSYQAVVRDGDGIPMPHKNVSFRMSIVDAEFGGNELYTETHDTITNEFGMVNFHVGLGNPLYGNMEDIPWGVKAYYLQIELDQSGGKNYKLMNKADLINHVASGSNITKATGAKKWFRIVVDSLGNLSTVRVVIWACGEDIIDERDSQEYSTVKIGYQCWLAENLNIGFMIPGSMTQANNDSIERYCYADSIQNCDLNGGLYQWNEMMQFENQEGVQGICPEGWHLPTESEWCTLENFVDAGLVMCTATGFRGIDCGANLKSATGWAASGNGNDQFGFTAVPAGYRLFYGAFSTSGENAFFWSSNEFNQDFGWFRQFTHNSDKSYRSNLLKSSGFSVRCIRD